VSLINRTKQNIRNLLAEKPQLAAPLIAAAFSDGLTYDPATGGGGLNGSIRFELDRPSNTELKQVVDEIVKARATTKDVSVADVIAFAGAVVLEVTSGPRVVVQLGREDASSADTRTDVPSFLDGSLESSADDWVAAFARCGFSNGAQEAVLLRGAIGILENIGNRQAEILGEEDTEEDEDLSYGDVRGKETRAVLVNSRVSSLTIKGGKFSNEYLSSLLASKDRENLLPGDRSLLENEATAEWVKKYAGNNRAFVQDFAELFGKLSRLGSQYTVNKLLMD